MIGQRAAVPLSAGDRQCRSFPESFAFHLSMAGGGFTLRGIGPGDFRRSSVDLTGDVNGDRFEDLIIATYRISAQAYGGIRERRTNGFRSAEIEPCVDPSVAGAGGINGDGFANVILQQTIEVTQSSEDGLIFTRSMRSGEERKTPEFDADNEGANQCRRSKRRRQRRSRALRKS